ncbi:MAG: hypothetical protein CL484_13610 [Acidobacteria bacterium]|nr:hypothetical protein [Acidobacteriota bacterium]
MGDEVVFVAVNDGRRSIWVVSSTGGNARQLVDELGQHDQPAWSPNGQLIAFVSTRNGDPDIWVVPTSGEGAEAFTAGPGNDFQPSWSPDGRWLAYRSIHEDQTDVWVVSASGGSAWKLTDDLAVERGLRWYPDSSGLVFTSSKSHTRVWEVSVEQGVSFALTPENVAAFDPKVSSKGEIAFLAGDGGRRDVYLVGLDVGEPVRLTKGPGSSADLQWSPDGQLIAFESSRVGSSDVWIVPPDGRAARAVTTSPARDISPRWSPDGTMLAFSSTRANGVLETWLTSIEDRGPVQLTMQGISLNPRWHPDGTEILFRAVASEDGQEHIWRLSLPDGTPEQLTETGYNAGADYGPEGRSIVYQRHEGSGFDLYVQEIESGLTRQLTNGEDDDILPRWSPDGRHIAFLSGLSRNRQLFVVSALGGEPTALTSSVGRVNSFDWSGGGSSLVYSWTAGATASWEVGFHVEKLAPR